MNSGIVSSGVQGFSVNRYSGIKAKSPSAHRVVVIETIAMIHPWRLVIIPHGNTQ
jgi:hypothetical protein